VLYEYEKNTIKAVVFDVGGVLIENPWNHMMGHFASVLQIEKEKLEMTLLEKFDEFERNHISEEVMWNHIMTRHNLGPKNVKGLWLKGLKKVFQEKQEMMRVVKQLKQKQYKVAILSNTEHPIAPFLEERYKQHFHSIILSPRVGLTKPQKEIYEYTLVQLGHHAHETLFIDDKKENIEGAKIAGMHAIHYTTHDVFLEELSHYVQIR